MCCHDEIAMQARLQLWGRSVGPHSHLEEFARRLPVQASRRHLSRHFRVAGYRSIAQCNVYMKCGLGLKDANLSCLHSIAASTDGGRRSIFAQGDWNITAADLNDSGVLDGLGLEIVLPSNGTIT